MKVYQFAEGYDRVLLETGSSLDIFESVWREGSQEEAENLMALYWDLKFTLGDDVRAAMLLTLICVQFELLYVQYAAMMLIGVILINTWLDDLTPVREFVALLDEAGVHLSLPDITQEYAQALRERSAKLEAMAEYLEVLDAIDVAMGVEATEWETMPDFND